MISTKSNLDLASSNPNDNSTHARVNVSCTSYVCCLCTYMCVQCGVYVFNWLRRFALAVSDPPVHQINYIGCTSRLYTRRSAIYVPTFILRFHSIVSALKLGQIALHMFINIRLQTLFECSKSK